MWDPQTYLAFSDHRTRPAHELLNRVGASSVRRAVDLGCGAGNLTPLLSQRWPDAVIEATDSSPEMAGEARVQGIDARVEDVRDWNPRPDTDVVFCNAVLQWVPGHVDLLRRWLPALPHGAWFAFQVPGNFDAPSHALVRDLAGSPAWQSKIGGVLSGSGCVLSPAGYAQAIADLGVAVDAWETTYLQRLTGDDAVLRWITGTALTPIRAVLDDASWERFRRELAPRLREAYPQRKDGTTWFPFRRIFCVAHCAEDIVATEVGA